MILKKRFLIVTLGLLNAAFARASCTSDMAYFFMKALPTIQYKDVSFAETMILDWSTGRITFTKVESDFSKIASAPAMFQRPVIFPGSKPGERIVRWIQLDRHSRLLRMEAELDAKGHVKVMRAQKVSFATNSKGQPEGTFANWFFMKDPPGGHSVYVPFQIQKKAEYESWEFGGELHFTYGNEGDLLAIHHYAVSFDSVATTDRSAPNRSIWREIFEINLSTDQNGKTTFVVGSTFFDRNFINGMAVLGSAANHPVFDKMITLRNKLKELWIAAENGTTPSIAEISASTAAKNEEAGLKSAWKELSAFMKANANEVIELLLSLRTGVDVLITQKPEAELRYWEAIRAIYESRYRNYVAGHLQAGLRHNWDTTNESYTFWSEIESMVANTLSEKTIGNSTKTMVSIDPSALAAGSKKSFYNENRYQFIEIRNPRTGEEVSGMVLTQYGTSYVGLNPLNLDEHIFTVQKRTLIDPLAGEEKLVDPAAKIDSIQLHFKMDASRGSPERERGFGRPINIPYVGLVTLEKVIGPNGLEVTEFEALRNLLVNYNVPTFYLSRYGRAPLVDISHSLDFNPVKMFHLMAIERAIRESAGAHIPNTPFTVDLMRFGQSNLTSIPP